MAVFNYLRKEIDAKIVYYGAGLGGKTTNLQFIHQHLKPDQRGKMVSLATDEDRTLFFDFLPIELENVRGFRTRFHLYTVPGQVYYGATRRAVLTGADGIIFVADSQIERMEENLFSLRDVEENLRYYGKKMETTPFIIQYNKRDLPNILSVEELNQKINHLNAPYFEAVATVGKGVFETLTMICRLVLKAIEAGVEARRPVAMGDTASEAPAAQTSRVERGVSRPEPLRVSEDAALAKPALGQEKDTHRPEPLRVSPDVASARSALRVAKDAVRPGPLRVSPDVASARSALRVEKDGLRPDSAKVGQDAASARLRMEKEAPSLETARTARIPSAAAPKPEGEAITGPGRTILSRILEKKKIEPSPKLEEEQEKKIPAASGEKMRILSCGQPRVSSPNSFEIPLTVEIEGLGKTLSLNLTITLEQVDQKIH